MTFLFPVHGVERVLFRALGVSDREMNWKQYLCAILGLNMLGLAVLFFMLLGQHYLPLNPQQLPGLSWYLAGPRPPSALSRIPTGNLTAVKPR
ncbi:potassium-transporting ATPase subunit KdpA [Escherichia coli]